MKRRSPIIGIDLSSSADFGVEYEMVNGKITAIRETSSGTRPTASQRAKTHKPSRKTLLRKLASSQGKRGRG